MSFPKSGSKETGVFKPKEKPPEAIPIQWRIDSWFTDLGDKGKVLKKFHAELIQSNKVINLVSAGSIVNADQIHFSDSIIACRIIFKASKGAKEIFDLGSGNGFPGVVYAILFPEVVVNLVESDSRKCEYLRTLVTRLDLKNVKVIEKQIEALPADSVKFAFSRGLAAIPKALLMTRKIFALGGTLYHIKGTEWPLEIAEMPTQLCSFWRSGLVSEYSLPIGDMKFFVVSSEKVS